MAHLDFTKTDVAPISIDETWKEILPEYQQARRNYIRVWNRKKMILVISYLFFILPGLIYHMSVWLPGISKRKRMAADVFQKTFDNLIQKHKNAQIENLSFAVNEFRQSKAIDLLSGKFLERRFDPMAIRGKISKNKKYVNSHQIYEILNKFGMLNHICHNYSYTPGMTLSFKAYVDSTSDFNFSIGDYEVKGGNLQIIFERVVSGRNGYDTQRSIAFSGLVFYLPEVVLPYPGALLTKQKNGFGNAENHFSGINWKKLKFPLSAAPFNDKFQVLVSEEKGPELRKTFNPRHMAKMVDLSGQVLPYTFAFLPGFGFTLIVKSFDRKDLPLEIENVSRFFHNEELAKEIIEKELSPFFMASLLVKNWEEQEFFSKK